ncbi:hypothetical protein, partial [Streptomyces sp. NPDC014733]|uniref:hypothetical protein n=1 Tax=Streptomyces sp. NPDC014733 TaxID=3364885 RepID=UPI0036F8C2D9
SGVDFWHAVEFSRNGRFLCACFTRPSGRFPSVLRFRLYQILSVLIFAGAVRPFGFSAVPTLPDPLGVSGPLLERGWPSCFRFPAFPTLSDPFLAVSGPNSFPITRRRGLPFGLPEHYQKYFDRIIGEVSAK